MSVRNEPRSEATRTESGFYRLGAGAWAMIIAVVALLSSLIPLVFSLVPSLKPDPRDSIAASVSVFAIDPQVTIGDYLARAYGNEAAGAKRLRIAAEEFGFRGDVVYVRTHVDGFKHRRVRLTAAIYLFKGQQRVTLPPTLFHPPIPAELESPSSSSVALIWIPSLAHEPAAFVRVEMYDGDKWQMLAVADSPIITSNLAPLPPTTG
jgi:hypothetical protein